MHGLRFRVLTYAGDAFSLVFAGLDIAVAAGTYKRLGAARALNPLTPRVDDLFLLFYRDGLSRSFFNNFLHMRFSLRT